MNRFKAPWGKSLWIMSNLGTVICLGVSLLLLRTNLPLRVNTLHFWLGLLPLISIAVAALFTVRGYSIHGESIFVQRLFWSTRLSLAGLQSVKFRPDVECIGAPILNYLGNVIAALSISGPQKKIGTPRERQFILAVVKAAALISSKMGYSKE